MHTKSSLEKLKGRVHSKNQDVDRNIRMNLKEIIGEGVLDASGSR
jgi:hypothetical protein